MPIGITYRTDMLMANTKAQTGIWVGQTSMLTTPKVNIMAARGSEWALIHMTTSWTYRRSSHTTTLALKKKYSGWILVSGIISRTLLISSHQSCVDIRLLCHRSPGLQPDLLSEIKDRMHQSCSDRGKRQSISNCECSSWRRSVSANQSQDTLVLAYEIKSGL